MPRITKAQKQALHEHLAAYFEDSARDAAIPLFTVSAVIDAFFHREVYPTLGPYTQLLPPGWTDTWVSAGGPDSVWSVLNPFAPTPPPPSVSAPVGFFDGGVTVDTGPAILLR